MRCEGPQGCAAYSPGTHSSLRDRARASQGDPNSSVPSASSAVSRCPPGSFPHLLLGSPQPPWGAALPHLHRCTHTSHSTPTLSSHTPYHPVTYHIIHLLTLLMSCPLWEGSDFCLFCSLVPPRVKVEMFKIKYPRAPARLWPGCRPCWCSLGKYQPWMQPQHLPEGKHLFNKYFLNE